MTPSTKKALAKYGQLTLLVCLHAHEVHGEGAHSISLTIAGAPDSVAATDACINAGRELRAVLRATGGLSYRPNGEGEGFTGSGVEVFRAAVIASGLRLYAKTGMKPNRAYTPRAMMDAATSMTGRQYKARAYEQASADLSQLCQLLKWAIAGQQEWSGSPCPIDPDNFWIDDKTGERVNAATGGRSKPKV